MLFPQASSPLLDAYLQCEHSVAPVAEVGPLAIVSVAPVVRVAWWYFTVWLVEHLVAGLFGIMVPLTPLPLYILVVGGCYSLTRLQSSQLILFTNCFFIPLFQWFSLFLLLLLGHLAALTRSHLTGDHPSGLTKEQTRESMGPNPKTKPHCFSCLFFC